MSSKNNLTVFVPSSVEAAAVEAALADGLISVNGLYVSDEKAKKAGLRRGKWTSEEEAYANRLIYEFKLGLLPLTEGTTLRTFLSKLLNCDPMRISKKFVGQNCIGKQVFRRRQQELEKLTPDQIELQRRELAELERKFLERVATTNRSKSAALPAAPAVAGVKGPSYEEDSSHAMPPWMAQILPTVSGGGGGGSIHSSAEASSSAGAGNSAAHFYLQQQAFQNGSYQSSGQPSRFDAAAYNPPPPHNSAAAAYSISSQPNDATFSQFRAAVPVASSRSNSGGVHRSSSGDGDGFNRNTSLEMLNTIAQLGSSTSSLEHLTDANALKQQQLQHQHRMHAFAPSASDPTRDVFPALAMNTNSSTFTLGDSVGWPSFGNLNSLNGGSMDDLLSAGLLSRQVSGGTPKDPAGQAAADEGPVGYSLEDSNPARGGGAAQVRVRAPIVDMAAMGSARHVGAGKSDSLNIDSSSGAKRSSNHNDNSKNNNVDNRNSAYSDHTIHRNTSSSSERLFESSHKEPSRLNGSLASIPKNGSVEDFWMLVNMGDLPQPEQDVLSQMVWSPLERAAAAAVAASSNSTKLNTSSSGATAGEHSSHGGGGEPPPGPGQGPLTMSPVQQQQQAPRSTPSHHINPVALPAMLLPAAVDGGGGGHHSGSGAHGNISHSEEEKEEEDRASKRLKVDPA